MSWMKQEFERVMAEQEGLQNHGGDRKSNNGNQTDNISLKSDNKQKFGTSRDYILKRLKRDHPSQFERVISQNRYIRFFSLKT